jgi:tRNA(Arg) A34 adenosine deaminase TadA
MKDMLQQAADLAYEVADGRKNFLLGCIAKRKDGAFVRSRNSTMRDPTPEGHAEARVLKKAGHGAILWVARVTRDGAWKMAKPCEKCQALIRNHGVKKVYYTIAPNEWGVWIPEKL